MLGKKIIVIGSPGAGKSSFARKLTEITSLPLYHLDLIWHRPDQTNISREEFDTTLGKILVEDSWIIDGNYQRTLERRLDACETVFFLDYPVEVCLSGAQERVGKSRADMPWVEDRLDEEFSKFIIDFADSTAPQIRKLLEVYAKKQIIIFKSRKESNDYIKLLTEKTIYPEAARDTK